MQDDDDTPNASTPIHREQSFLTSISSNAILQLILAHLTESGCHQTVAQLQQESGVGLAAPLVTIPQIQHWIRQGQWDIVLQNVSILDRRYQGLVADVTIQTVLELADDNEWETAYALLRTQQQQVNSVFHTDDEENGKMLHKVSDRLAELAALRDQDRNSSVPANYYSTLAKNTTRKVPQDTVTRQSRREEMAQQIGETIQQQPSQRLATLLQQALQWQAYTGQIPLHVAQHFTQEENNEGANVKSTPNEQEWDLVLGQADAMRASNQRRHKRQRRGASTVTQRYATIKFGQHAVCTAADFGSHPTLVTGSSDGMVELWDATTGKLRTDLPYQTDETVLTHEGGGASVTALAVAKDGTLLATAGNGETVPTVCVWRLDKGKLLRRFPLSNATSATALAWAPNGERLLVGCSDGTVREFGLRSGRQLKVFTSDTSSSYVTLVAYHADSGTVSVVTSAGDGAMRFWDGATAECRQVLVPHSSGSKLSSVGDKLPSETNANTPPLQSVLSVSSYPNGWIMVPRSTRAFCVNSVEARVQQVFDSPKQTSIMTAATTSPYHLYIATEDSSTRECECHAYDLSTGNRLKTITTSLPSGSRLFYRPYSDILAVYSPDQQQKKGKLYLWR